MPRALRQNLRVGRLHVPTRSQWSTLRSERVSGTFDSGEIVGSDELFTVFNLYGECMTCSGYTKSDVDVRIRLSCVPGNLSTAFSSNSTLVILDHRCCYLADNDAGSELDCRAVGDEFPSMWPQARGCLLCMGLLFARSTR